jgi:dCMP deaminase
MTKNFKLLNIALAVSALSKDPSTQVGAIILGPDGEGGPWGYNGAPRGCRADEDERIETRPEKYFWVEHAERNAIYTAARTGFRTVGATMVVTHAPCIDCARAIVQAGIKKVMFPSPSPELVARWGDSFTRAEQLFNECRVELEFL